MDQKDIIPRIGTFFVVIGIGTVLLFIISDIAEKVYFDFLFIGLFFTGIGFFLRRNAEKPPESGRFSYFKKMREKGKEKKKDK